MSNDLGALLSADIPDPVAFFLEEKIDFLHQLKSIASLLSLARSEDEKILTQIRSRICAINNYTLIGKSVNGRMPAELRQEFLGYLIASESLYNARQESGEEIREMAEWAGEAYTTFIHKAEDLRKSQHI